MRFVYKLLELQKVVIPASKARLPAGRQVGNPSEKPSERFRTSQNDNLAAKLSSLWTDPK